MKTYHSSPAYLAFLAAKTKAKASKCETNYTMITLDIFLMKLFLLLSAADVDTHETPSRPSKAAQQDRRIEIQPAEDEEGKFSKSFMKYKSYVSQLKDYKLSKP